MHARRIYLVQSLSPLPESPCIKNIVPCRKESTLHCEADSHKLLPRSGRISPTKSGTLLGTTNRSICYGKSPSTCVYPLCLERVFSHRPTSIPPPDTSQRLVCLWRLKIAFSIDPGYQLGDSVILAVALRQDGYPVSVLLILSARVPNSLWYLELEAPVGFVLMGVLWKMIHRR